MRALSGKVLSRSAFSSVDSPAQARSGRLSAASCTGHVDESLRDSKTVSAEGDSPIFVAAKLFLKGDVVSAAKIGTVPGPDPTARAAAVTRAGAAAAGAFSRGGFSCLGLSSRPDFCTGLPAPVSGFSAFSAGGRINGLGATVDHLRRICSENSSASLPGGSSTTRVVPRLPPSAGISPSCTKRFSTSWSSMGLANNKSRLCSTSASTRKRLVGSSFLSELNESKK